MKFNVVQNWIDNVAYSHSKSKGTEYNYRHYLNVFCDFIEKTPELILEEYERMTDREFRRKYARYIRALIGELSSQEYAICTIRMIVTCIKSFFKYNDLPLGHIPIARTRITFHNRDITKEEIVKILEISRPRDKAFFCMMAQTGLRPDTLSRLRLKHIQPDFEKGIIPCKIDVPQDIAKGKYKSYLTFMGKESVKHLQRYLNTRQIAPEHYLFTSHGTEKQLDSKSMSHIFRRAIITLRQKGIMNFEQKQKGKPSNVRLYNLRKYFRKMATPAGFEFVQFWMGHMVNEGQDEHYRPKDVEFHRRLYKEKVMPFLRLETSTPTETEQTIVELRNQITEIEQRHQDELKKMENHSKRETEWMDEGMKQLRKEVNELRKMVQTYMKDEEGSRKIPQPKIVTAAIKKAFRDMGKKAGEKIEKT